MTDQNDTDDRRDAGGETVRGYVIPKWFVNFVAFVLALILPWAAWLTLEIVRIGVRMETIPAMDARITQNASSAIDVVQIRAEQDAMRERLTKLERQLENIAEGS